ncbi:MAG: antibiotic biosynthesis monooxygenase [Dehalococcoidia bacterium]|nr:antibiotic biosynthesis monooxygenase [Dehalococcoidia bacterium]
MAVKVLVERRVRKGYEGWVWHMLRDLRAEALRTHGYLYGESWRSPDDHRIFMSLSVWGSLEQWQVWAQSDVRLKAEERINRLLRKPGVVKVFEDAVDPFLEEPHASGGRRPRQRQQG